ncbi:MAG: iron-containing redox enzyme family protein [Planctomycetes bacterium]|nr:iron-containing redox enzyme family protein [Planctomycetota bacterium]
MAHSGTTAEYDRDQIMELARQVLVQSGILDNAYFQSLTSGQMARDLFVRSQQQFYFAVLEFPRPMFCLLARIPAPGARLGLLDNVVEEHGFFEEARFHATTFRQFCTRLAGTEFDPGLLEQGPVVRAFNRALLGVCQSESIEFGFACLGIIELAFASISNLIGQAVVDRGWLTGNSLVHYRLHAERDLEHAAELFAPLQGSVGNAARQRDIGNGLQLGVYLFDRLYRDLLEPATWRGWGF